MTRHRVAAERTIPAAPSTLYTIIRDYRNHHPNILPAAFRDFTIESGGIGAGTIFTRAATQSWGELRVDNEGLIGAHEPTVLNAPQLDSLHIARGARLDVPGDLALGALTSFDRTVVNFFGTVTGPGITSLTLGGETTFHQPWSFPPGVALRVDNGTLTIKTPAPIALSSLDVVGSSVLTVASASAISDSSASIRARRASAARALRRTSASARFRSSPWR